MISQVVIGSRGSALALVQAEWVKAHLASLHPNTEFHIQIIKTTGDVQHDPLSVIGGKGVFTKELEDALLLNRIDVAVHSLKDLPTLIPEGLELAAVCEREDPRDALVVANTDCTSLEDLPVGAVVGTSSPRRLAQLIYLRPDLKASDVRGNVDTRLRKLDEGQYDALVLAVAGLKRLGLESRITLAISSDEMVPAVGQGALGLQTRAQATVVNQMLRELDHYETRVACTAERALLNALGGGCQLPIAAFAKVDAASLTLDGLVASRDGKRLIRMRSHGSVTEPQKLGNELAQRLIEKGANELL